MYSGNMKVPLAGGTSKCLELAYKSSSNNLITN